MRRSGPPALVRELRWPNLRNMRGRAPPRCTWHLGVGDMADDWCSWPQGAIAPVIESFVRTRQSHSAFIEGHGKATVPSSKASLGHGEAVSAWTLPRPYRAKVRPEHQFTGNVGLIWSQRYFLIVSGIEEGAPSASSRPSIARGRDLAFSLSWLSFSTLWPFKCLQLQYLLWRHLPRRRLLFRRWSRTL